MNNDQDEFSERVRATLDRSTEQLDADTLSQLQQARANALASANARPNLRPAMMIAASLVALILVPWLALRQPPPSVDVATLDNAFYPADQDYLTEDPELLADWEMLDAIGEVPDA